MLEVRRLDRDASWWMRWDDTAVVIDPWLVGSEVDGFRWFNEQWHATPPVHPDEVPAYDAVIITQSYDDHCHRRTLDALPEGPRLAVPRALPRVHGWGLTADLVPTVPGAVWRRLGSLEVGCLDPGRRVDPVYYALVLKRGDEAVVHAPHGFSLSPAQRALMDGLRVRLLVTTFLDYRLPALLGGRVSPGLEAGLSLAQALDAERVAPTHDEDKISKGLVRRLARVRRVSPETLSDRLGDRLLAPPDDRVVAL